jgi:non-specific serine/threonine protein kinase
LLWRIDVSLGRLLRAQRRYDEAEDALTAARSTIDDLATQLSDRLLREAFLERAAALLPPARPVSPRRAAKEAFAGLTTREREVAALIARGKTNREIAEYLVIGEVTVATHVGHILAKLGFTSRAQIAAWAVDKGLATPS